MAGQTEALGLHMRSVNYHLYHSAYCAICNELRTRGRARRAAYNWWAAQNMQKYRSYNDFL
jgi:hypothetical protein